MTRPSMKHALLGIAALAIVATTCLEADAGWRRQQRRAWRHGCCEPVYQDFCSPCGEQYAPAFNSCPCGGGTAWAAPGGVEYSAARPIYPNDAVQPTQNGAYHQEQIESNRLRNDARNMDRVQPRTFEQNGRGAAASPAPSARIEADVPSAPVPGENAPQLND
ncbi:hypothetical protein [Planctomicrobium sp. SH664]|uniref:hypothetical protein n=1 Tax=Planctomicrobium sp. SH664 TaxID=3448125 RepID=UPI003F5BB749